LYLSGKLLAMRKVLFVLILLSSAVWVNGQHDTTRAPFAAPIYPGGLDSMYRELEAHFRISRTDLTFQQHQDLIGDVRLTIGKRGEVVHVTGGTTQIEYELERAFRSLPPFTPAMLNGKPVTSYLELKFMFIISGNRMQVIEHLSDHSSTRTKESGWLKATLVGAAIALFLILWGV